MSLQTSMCDTLSNQLNKYDIALDKTIPGLDGINTLITDLSTFSASSQSVIDQTLIDMTTILSDNIPDFTAPSNILDVSNFIQNCSYLQTHTLLNNSLVFINGLSDILKSNILAAFLLLGIPEITLSVKMINLDYTINNLGLNQMIPNISSVLTCLSSASLCNRDMSVETASHDTFKSTYKINSLGKLDTVTLFSEASITGIPLANFTLIKDLTYDSVTQVNISIANFDPENIIIPPTVSTTVTDLYLHYNTPTYLNSSSTLAELDPNFSTELDLTSKWSILQTAPGIPIGTTTRTGLLDVSIEITGTNTRVSQYSLSGISYSKEIILCKIKITVGTAISQSSAYIESTAVLSENFNKLEGGLLLRSYKLAAIAALEKTINLFEVNEIENQLSIYE